MTTSRPNGFSLLELLIVIAIVAVLAGISAPLYVNWRATSLHTEAIRVVEARIAFARAEAKRAGGSMSVVIGHEEGEIVLSGATPSTTALPGAGEFRLVGTELSISFEPIVGTQDPFQPIDFVLQTGGGASERSSRLFVVPPLGKLGVVRQ